MTVELSKFRDIRTKDSSHNDLGLGCTPLTSLASEGVVPPLVAQDAFTGFVYGRNAVTCNNDVI